MDLQIQDNADGNDGNHRDFVAPVGQDQVQRGDFEGNEESLI